MKNYPTISDLFDQAIQYTDQKQINLALQIYDQIIRIQPNHAIAYNNMGILFNQIDQFQNADVSFDRATHIDPSYANAWFNWGNTLKEQDEFDLAIEKYKMAISYQPTFAEAYNNMGECYLNCDQLDKSIEAYQKAVSINPRLAGTLYNLGNVYYKNHQYQQALTYFKQCIAIQPDNKDAHYHFSFTLLLLGDYANGFQEYEWRLRRGPYTGDILNRPFWDGKTASEKTLFVYSEQGFGDNIQFCRYLPMIAGKVKQIVFGARSEQVRLFQTIPCVDQVIGQGERLPPFDIHCSLLSLPYLFQTNDKTIPCNTPYLFPELLKQQSEQYQTINKQACDMLRVGIVWGGNPENKNDQSRSIPLSTWAKLFSIAGIRWFSFQKGLHTKEIHAYETQIVDLSIYFNDFYDTAQALCQMDLLISVDTSVAHLAGALGIPFWLLIPPQPDWRWLLNQSDNPWYPTCLIFRQAIDDHGWQNVINQIFEKLHAVLSHQPDPTANAYFSEGLKHNYAQNTHMACIAFQKTISRYPVSWEADHNLSRLFARQGNIHNAIIYAQRACRKHTQNAFLWQHLGNLYAHCENIDTAITCLRYAQQISNYTHAKINYDLGQLLLLNGQWTEGLKWNEYRRKCDVLPERRKYDMPHWDGHPFRNKTLLLYSELQDKSFMMYLRFAPLLKQLGGTVVLESTPGMYRLVMNNLCVDRIFYYPNNQDSESVRGFDIQAPLESLPYLLQIPEESIALAQPYIQTRKRFVPLETFIQSHALLMKIGISWFSEPAEIEKHHQILLSLMPILQLEHISFFHIGYYSLTSIESIEIPNSLIDLSTFLDDSHDLASAIDQMDMILSFDNLIGHLAGAMFKTVYMILSKRPDWFWKIRTNQSIWYPTMKLFRETDAFDCQLILQAIIQKLPANPKKSISVAHFNQDAMYLHAIGSFEGITGVHIHTQSFFGELGTYIPVLESDIQLKKRLNISVDFLNHEIIPTKRSVFNIAICPIHQFEILSCCPGLKIGYVLWESTSIPDDWMNSLSHADVLWSPSQWFKQILINHGIAKNSIQVVPGGVNARIFKTEGPQFQFLNNIQAYKFLYVGKLEERKSTPELIVTFDHAFRDNPDVRLVLCTQSFKKDFDYNHCIQSLGLRHPEKILHVGPFASTLELAALYRSCDAFVMPTRAEGWGLPIIEAMACGLPVIVTGYSALTDFVTNENAYLINFKMTDIEKPLGWHTHSKTTNYGQWAEPDFIHLQDMMQYVFKHRDQAKKRGLKASQEIRSRWTWNHAAKKAIDALTNLQDIS